LCHSSSWQREFQNTLEAYQRGDGRLNALAGRFGVSRGWAEKIWRALRQTGRMERPAGAPRGPASKVTPAVQEQLRGWVKQQPDLTLLELQRRLDQDLHLKVSMGRLWTVLGKMGLRLKKVARKFGAQRTA